MIPPLARRFVAGESAAAAIEYTRGVNSSGVGVILNLLGEHYDDRAEADADTEAYIRLLEDLAGTDLRARVSVKPSQLGLDLGPGVFDSNLARILDRAAAADRFVWVDMEGPDTIEPTLDVVHRQARRNSKLGVAIQANMKRTGSDLERLAGTSVAVRLVKGAYDPPAEAGYREKSAVDRAYREHLEYLFEHFDGGIAVGSHDPAMIDLAADLHQDYGTPYEIQMLMGVREDAQRQLAADRPVWRYVPYGDQWLSYFYRRVAERRENLLFALRALVS
ncbi:MAG: proline dehydrogenase family protein [Salinirussus sp.]